LTGPTLLAAFGLPFLDRTEIEPAPGGEQDAPSVVSRRTAIVIARPARDRWLRPVDMTRSP
jgi:hypothetical protein